MHLLLMRSRIAQVASPAFLAPAHVMVVGIVGLDAGHVDADTMIGIGEGGALAEVVVAVAVAVVVIASPNRINLVKSML
jgi:hypothetical protein